jgi:hypothetical protein
MELQEVYGTCFGPTRAWVGSLKVVRAFAEEMIGHARERMRNAPGEPPGIC